MNKIKCSMRSWYLRMQVRRLQIQVVQLQKTFLRPVRRWQDPQLELPFRG